MIDEWFWKVTTGAFAILCAATLYQNHQLLKTVERLLHNLHVALDYIAYLRRKDND